VVVEPHLTSLAKTLKLSLEEAKKQNLIVEYKILLGDAATPQDFDILVMVESKNMAALDNAREKFDPITRKTVGTTDQQQAMAVKCLDTRPPPQPQKLCTIRSPPRKSRRDTRAPG
jgi:hypothetical protein